MIHKVTFLWLKIIELVSGFIHCSKPRYLLLDFVDDIVHDDVRWLIDMKVEDSVRRSVRTSVFNLLTVDTLKGTLSSSERLKLTESILKELE